jgi:hypothetical protein
MADSPAVRQNVGAALERHAEANEWSERQTLSEGERVTDRGLRGMSFQVVFFVRVLLEEKGAPPA